MNDNISEAMNNLDFPGLKLDELGVLEFPRKTLRGPSRSYRKPVPVNINRYIRYKQGPYWRTPEGIAHRQELEMARLRRPTQRPKNGYIQVGGKWVNPDTPHGRAIMNNISRQTVPVEVNGGLYGTEESKNSRLWILLIAIGIMLAPMLIDWFKKLFKK